MAYQFAQANTQKLDAGTSFTVSGYGSFSVAAWFYENSANTGADGRGIVSKDNLTTQRQFNLATISSKVRLFVGNTSGLAIRRDTSTNVTSATWQHVCGVLTASTACDIYYNGSLDNGVTSGTAPAAAGSSTSPLLIGGFNNAATVNHLDGRIAEVGIWNAALTAAEIASLAKGMTCDKVRPQSLVFYSPLCRDLIDYKGGLTITNNNTATVANHPRVYA
jgi:hypothetical protein